MAQVAYSRPDSLEQVLAILSENNQCTLWAGGTDLTIKLTGKRIDVSHILDLTGVPELAFIKDGNPVVVGAMSTINQIDNSEIIRREFPFLAHAAHLLGSWQIRNLATIGGNLVNAAPSAETSLPILVIGGIMLVQGPDGPRRIHSKDFFTGPGQTALKKSEILCAVELPLMAQGFRSIYLKHSLRKSMDISLVSVATALRFKDGICLEARIGLGAVAPVPMRATKSEDLLAHQSLSKSLIKEAAELAAAECRPIDDIRASASYRKEMVEVMVKRALTTLWERGEMQ